MGRSSNSGDAFMACARLGNFTKASEKLHITQSALSQRIINLEDELGLTLFIRDRKGIRLTISGERLMRYCVAKEEMETEALRELKSGFRNQIAGTVRVGGFSSVMRSVILPALSTVLQDHKNTRLQFFSREMNELPGYLRRGEIDYMIINYEMNQGGIESLYLGDEKNVLVEKRGYKGDDVYLDHDENDQITSQYLKMIKHKTSYDRNFMDDVYGLIDGVKNGLGRAVIPRHLISEDKNVRIVNNTELKIPIYLHFYTQPYYSKLHDLVVEGLKKINI